MPVKMVRYGGTGNLPLRDACHTGSHPRPTECQCADREYSAKVVFMPSSVDHISTGFSVIKLAAVGLRHRPFLYQLLFEHGTFAIIPFETCLTLGNSTRIPDL